MELFFQPQHPHPVDHFFSLRKIVENDTKVKKKKLQDFHILCVLVDMKNNKLEF
jgi:hypothetical protein